ncbi:hypothetical protein WDW89_09465 [Deltaproteobacteria bacterium TL4]
MGIFKKTWWGTIRIAYAFMNSHAVVSRAERKRLEQMGIDTQISSVMSQK